MAAPARPAPGVIRSLIPARMDRMPWSRFHTRMVVALGAVWILDGLEITVASAVADVWTQPETLGLTSTQAGLAATVYLAGEVSGALFFGRLSDRFGRRNLFMITLGVYLVGSAMTAFTLGSGVGWLVFFYASRFIAGMGIGGEYAAINSAIDELIPAHVPRPGGHRRQRHVLGRRGRSAVGHVHPARHDVELDLGWRIALPDRPGARPRDPLRPAAPAGEPALAGDERPGGGGRESRRAASRRRCATSGRRAAAGRREQGDRAAGRTDQIGFVALTRVLFREYPRRVGARRRR